MKSSLTYCAASNCREVVLLVVSADDRKRLIAIDIRARILADRIVRELSPANPSSPSQLPTLRHKQLLQRSERLQQRQNESRSPPRPFHPLQTGWTSATRRQVSKKLFAVD